ncbi:MAG TPA: hypothetical protein VK886_15310 [Vicinamibacterales bacterium]|nr:hypothetical protein [Vicinamibacterales bacterium]
MAEVLIEYSDLIQSEEGRSYRARACTKKVSAHSWHGWIEFEPVDGGEPIRSPRETTQPNRTDAEYWATGLTPVYLEGALRRALHPLTLRVPPEPQPPAFDGPAPEPVPAPSGGDSVLNPFSVYQKGEALLRNQLSAFSTWHLVNIVRAHGIPTGGRDPNRMTAHSLIEAIVAAARRQAGVTTLD